ncbi:MAG: xanthine dehydrogenase family protein subunit M [Bradyrhizobium sp.]|nr:xanthine dehydrogenase family protein subunit M [Bradyrhizobium sp.]
MNRFEYIRADSVSHAVQALAVPNAQALAGGTNLVDLMKYDVARPARVVDINRLPLRAIEATPAGGLKIGALVSNSDLAWDSRISERFPLLASAILAGASAQLRNAATTGGNLLQRTRCYYFYDPSTPCNKRQPGSGCSAIDGINRIHAILGASDQCIAVHPSDMCVALAALDAIVHLEGPDGARKLPFGEFHRLPEDRPQHDNTMRPGELITAVELPPSNFTENYTYLKVRERLSYAFALVSVAAALTIEAGAIADARLALGGVAHKPWRDRKIEEWLRGKVPDESTFAECAGSTLRGARGYGQNEFKIELARRTIIRALRQAAAGMPQDQADKVVR